MINIPTINEIRTNLSNDIKTRLSLVSSTLKKVFNALVASLSGQFKLLYLYLSDVQENIFADTADSELVGGTLERHGRIQLGRDPFASSSGTFELSVTGEAGSILRAGLTFKSNEDSAYPGEMYILDLEYELTGTDDLIEVRSLNGGEEVNLDAGDELTITEPVIGVDQTVSVNSVVTLGLAAETLDDYRQKILDAIQLEPTGGSRTDYRLWAYDVQGVRKVYPYVRDSSPGNVDVYVEAVETITTVNGVPTTDILDEVSEVIEFDPDTTKPLNERGRRPMQATVTVLAINPIPVSITITGLSTSTSDIQSTITENIKTFLASVRPYISGADLERNKNNILSLVNVQSYVFASLTNGNSFTSLTLSVDGNVVTNYEFSLNNIPYLESITFN